jgi:hypothetical protein
MKICSFVIRIVMLVVCMSAPGRDGSAIAASPAFPLKPSADGRYLVDAAGAPFFVHADTAWQAPKRLTLSEFEEYLSHRARLGFNTVFLHTFSREVSPDNNRNGDRPFDPANDISAPNEPYWKHLDKVLALAEEKGFFVAIAPLWIRWGGNDTAGWRVHFAEEHAQAYGEFLGKRYADRKNIMWIVGGDANPQEKTKAIDLLASGIKQTAPHHLITVHNRPENSSASYFDAVPWLDVNMAYSYRETYIHVGGEWNRLGQRRPVMLGESGYEEESNDGRGGSTHRVRRQAYGAILSGAVAGHAFGNKHIWRCDEDWRKALDSPGSQQMVHVRNLFTSIPWYKLIPDDQYQPPPPEFAELADAMRSKQLITAGRGLYGGDDYMPAAIAEDGSFAIVYLPVARPVTINLRRFAGMPNASWYDPTDGTRHEIEDISADKQYQEFTPPQKNAAGDTDWVLVLDTPLLTEQRKVSTDSP